MKTIEPLTLEGRYYIKMIESNFSGHAWAHGMNHIDVLVNVRNEWTPIRVPADKEWGERYLDRSLLRDPDSTPDEAFRKIVDYLTENGLIKTVF